MYYNYFALLNASIRFPREGGMTRRGTETPSRFIGGASVRDGLGTLGGVTSPAAEAAAEFVVFVAVGRVGILQRIGIYSIFRI